MLETTKDRLTYSSLIFSLLYLVAAMVIGEKNISDYNKNFQGIIIFGVFFLTIITVALYGLLINKDDLDEESEKDISIAVLIINIINYIGLFIIIAFGYFMFGGINTISKEDYYGSVASIFIFFILTSMATFIRL